MSNAYDKLSVLNSFIEEVNSYLPEIEDNLAHLSHTPSDMEVIEETYRRAHTIGGSASMMDFPGLAHVAHGMEDLLGDALEGLSTLDIPTLALLQRSLHRVHRLIEGIHGQVDENAVIAEDDADYVQYRTFIETQAQIPHDDQVQQAAASISPVSQPELSSTIQQADSDQSPSLDEVLASFRTPVPDEADNFSWTGAVSLDSQPAIPPTNNIIETPVDDAAPITPVPSALDMLVATTRQLSTDDYIIPYSPASAMYDDGTSEPSIARHLVPADSTAAQLMDQSSRQGVFRQAYQEMQQDTSLLEQSARSLKDVLSQLRVAMSTIAAQRSEFKDFLDGSKNALDRMEVWAGRAMGLNLRNSPEQVRRYLPLSVMWVTNTKLNKILELLTQIVDNVELTDNQFATTIQQLSFSIASCGSAFEQLQAEQHAPTFPQQSAWTAWEMQVARDEQALSERVTFERIGDPLAIRAEVEARVREEVRQEYEASPAALAARAELEQQVRHEILQEFEARRQLHESVAGPIGSETLEELTSRLRNELEIHVRQEFLSQILIDEDDLLASTALTHKPELANTHQVSNYLDQVREATGLPTPYHAPLPQSALPAPISQQSSQTSSSASDFGEEASEIFRLEAEEHLQSISMYTAALEKDPSNRDIVQGIRRAIHTLKGAASMMGFRPIAELSHISEDLLDQVMEGVIIITPPVLSVILDTAETLDVLITNTAGDNNANDALVQSMRLRFEQLLGPSTSHMPSLEDTIDLDDVIEEADAESAAFSNAISGAQLVGSSRTAPADLSVRVPLLRLDELVNLFGELLVNRSVLEERIERLLRLIADVSVSSARLQDVGQKLESRFEASTLPSGHSFRALPTDSAQPQVSVLPTNGNRAANTPTHLQDFDELELDRYTEFHQLTRGLSEGISDMSTLSSEMEAIIRECESVFGRENRLSTTFQDRLMKARLVPLTTLSHRLYRAARAVALKQHKEFEFLLEGEEIEVDRTVYEEIAGPLLHLVRNAVNHALETPEARLQKGKSASGLIKLSAAYEGNLVVITVRDDGTGIDPERVRIEAINRGLIRPNQTLNDSELIDLIFQPGFSTAETLSEESGRGVGLDVVRDSVSRLRGTLEVESTPGHGTAFTMKFPTSLAIQSVMMVRAGGHQFAIPTVIVEAIGRLDNFKRAPSSKRPAILVQNETYPLSTLSELLSLPVNPLEDKTPLLLINSGGYRVALVIDEIRGKLDVVMKNLGPHLRNVHGIAGGTVMGNGRVVLILELTELLATKYKPVSALKLTSTPTRQENAPASQSVAHPVVVSVPAQQRSSDTRSPATQAQKVKQGKYVLIVDDSPSVRRVVSSMLKQHNWEVQQARDGVEAVDMITHEMPLAVLLDIEMPRMDGYELIATLRAQEQYRTLPLVVLTSRAASKHQQRAIQLGANGYLIKPYQDEELINTLNTLVYGAATR